MGKSKATKKGGLDKDSEVQNVSELSPRKEGQQEQKPGVKKDKKGSEIDDIFSQVKSKCDPKEPIAEGKQQSDIRDVKGPDGKRKVKPGNETNDPKSSIKKPKIEGNKDDILGEGERANRKRTEEGFAIYTEDELGLQGKGGGTSLCPFDCNCCF